MNHNLKSNIRRHSSNKQPMGRVMAVLKIAAKLYLTYSKFNIHCPCIALPKATLTSNPEIFSIYGQTICLKSNQNLAKVDLSAITLQDWKLRSYLNSQIDNSSESNQVSFSLVNDRSTRVFFLRILLVRIGSGSFVRAIR